MLAASEELEAVQEGLEVVLLVGSHYKEYKELGDGTDDRSSA